MVLASVPSADYTPSDVTSVPCIKLSENAANQSGKGTPEGLKDTHTPTHQKGVNKALVLKVSSYLMWLCSFNMNKMGFIDEKIKDANSIISLLPVGYWYRKHFWISLLIPNCTYCLGFHCAQLNLCLVESSP